MFLSSCEYIEAQEQLTALLGLHGSTSAISITSIASYVASTNIETAFKQFCKGLNHIGITEDMIQQKEDKILEILRSQSMVPSGRNNVEEDQILETAYKEFCKELYQIGVTKDYIPPKNKVLGVLRSRSVVASRQSSGSSIGDKG